MSTPRLSIGMPVYNGADFLRTAVDSILDQDYRDFELIISDNASTDGTFAICKQYAASDARVRYLRNETNIGAAANYNRVFELARSEFFKWAAHDDVHLPGFLRRCMEILDEAPASVVLVAPRTEIIDESGQRITTSVPPERLDTRWNQPHRRLADVLQTVSWAHAQFGLIRAEALRKTRMMGPFYASDYILLAELAMLGEIWEIPEVLFRIRWHPGVSTQANKSSGELLLWFDPSQSSHTRLLSPHARLGLEYARSINRMPLAISERMLCHLSTLATWYPRECHRLVVNCRNKIGFRTRLKSLLSRGKSYK